MSGTTKPCADYGELISAYLDDELDGLELSDLGRHLRSCGKCAGEVDRLMAVKTSLRRAEPFWPRPEVPPGFAGSVARVLEAQAPPPAVFRRRPRLAAAWGAGVMAVVLAAAGLLVVARSKAPVTPAAPLAGDPAAVMLAQTDADDEVERYLREHVLESSRSALVDSRDSVELIDHVAP